MRATLLTAVLALTLAGCASAQQAAGPAVTGSSLATTTAALQCSGPVYRTEHAADYADGLATVSQDAAHAMAQFVRQGVVQTLPTDGYRSEPAEGDRLLYSYAVGGRRKVALLLDPDVRDYTGHVGWGVASWAMCDPSELPAQVNDAAGLQVWTDRSGARVPVTRIQSFAGPAHCSWQSITFLVLDAGGGGAASKKQQQFLRDPDGELAEFERGRFRAHTALPGRAHDTGLSRAGRELWLAADGSAAYLVSKGDPSDVERWPAATQPIGCA